MSKAFNLVCQSEETALVSFNSGLGSWAVYSGV